MLFILFFYQFIGPFCHSFPFFFPVFDFFLLSFKSSYMTYQNSIFNVFIGILAILTGVTVCILKFSVNLELILYDFLQSSYNISMNGLEIIWKCISWISQSILYIWLGKFYLLSLLSVYGIPIFILDHCTIFHVSFTLFLSSQSSFSSVLQLEFFVKLIFHLFNPAFLDNVYCIIDVS